MFINRGVFFSIVSISCLYNTNDSLSIYHPSALGVHTSEHPRKSILATEVRFFNCFWVQTLVPKLREQLNVCAPNTSSESSLIGHPTDVDAHVLRCEWIKSFYPSVQSRRYFFEHRQNYKQRSRSSQTIFGVRERFYRTSYELGCSTTFALVCTRIYVYYNVLIVGILCVHIDFVRVVTMGKIIWDLDVTRR
jgi:hypothetical protein